eukprot:1507447-Rhodomonas_salina.3
MGLKQEPWHGRETERQRQSRGQRAGTETQTESKAFKFEREHVVRTRCSVVSCETPWAACGRVCSARQILDCGSIHVSSRLILSAQEPVSQTTRGPQGGCNTIFHSITACGLRDTVTWHCKCCGMLKYHRGHRR